MPPKGVLFESPAEWRMTAFYPKDGVRRSTSSSLTQHGEDASLWWCLRWAWKHRLAACRHETCPAQGLMDAF
eukprot:9293676-Lingulodinium_polyedra.AAC.1